MYPIHPVNIAWSRDMVSDLVRNNHREPPATKYTIFSNSANPSPASTLMIMTSLLYHAVWETSDCDEAVFNTSSQAALRKNIPIPPPANSHSIHPVRRASTVPVLTTNKPRRCFFTANNNESAAPERRINTLYRIEDEPSCG
jgi:hypothetical protein